MKNRFKEWWQRPIRRRDRVSAAFVGLFGGFWIGFLGFAFTAKDSVPLSTVLLWGLGVAIVCAIIAAIYPKHATVLLYPFALFGIGS